jgi:hypothetical protein
MTPQELIKAAYDRLVDDHDEDPRSPLIRDLGELLRSPAEIPADDRIHLTATVQPGGHFSVTDQHGRLLDGVQSVAVFRDQAGRDVMQINL